MELINLGFYFERDGIEGEFIEGKDSKRIGHKCE
jgi:hypothetical protein